MKRSAFILLAIVVAGGVFAISPLKDKTFDLFLADRQDSQPVERGLTRSTTSGNVVGDQAANSALSWKGIPYARPPLGQLRWHAPQPPWPWAGVRQTRVDGPPCFQFGTPAANMLFPSGNETGSEDCLYLSVQAPAGSASVDRLPVIVWIHGGDNNTGAAPSFDSGHLVPNHDVILVAPSYRLGGLGWFSHRALRQTGEASGNFGTLDLIAALNWVQDNIAAFGGDPENVTLAGQTAGADNILSLLGSPLTTDLFHQVAVGNGEARSLAASQSEGFNGPRTNSTDEVIARLLIADGLVTGRSEAAEHIATTPAQELVRYLRAKSPFEILAAYERAVDTGPYNIPTIFRDGLAVSSDDPHTVFSDIANYRVVPMILGSSRDSAKTDMMRDSAFTMQNGFESPIPKDLLAYDRIAHYRGAADRYANVDGLARLLAEGGHEEVYAYRFDWDEQPIVLGTDYGVLQGAARGLEIPFILGQFAPSNKTSNMFTAHNRQSREALSAATMSYWAGLAHNATPGEGLHGDQVRWSPWNLADEAEKALILDTSAGGGVRMTTREITALSLEEEINVDRSLPSSQQKCAIARFLNNQTPIWSELEIATLFAGACIEGTDVNSGRH